MPEKVKKEIDIKGVEKKEVYVLSIQDILRRKVDLLSQYIGVDEEKFKKHCLDIGYFIAK
jgi:protein associated with RNAse G/E